MTKPTLGYTPKLLWLDARNAEIKKAIVASELTDQKTPEAWVKEWCWVLAQINKCKDPELPF